MMTKPSPLWQIVITFHPELAWDQFTLITDDQPFSIDVSLESNPFINIRTTDGSEHFYATKHIISIVMTKVTHD